ncbi:MAG TPA: EAL domain-containing protein [Candidatus Limnocylindria bacterium]|nr:EAL domain-containing protein [Candidatus Limnocylindria bacterium]
MSLVGTDELLRAALGRSQALVAFIEGDTLVLASDGARSLVGDREESLAALRTLLASVNADETGATAHVEGSIDGPSGEARRVTFELTVLREAPDRRLLAIGQDVTAQWAREADLARRATTDVLTGLPNRALLADRIARALLTAEREGTSAALIVLDLDYFKGVNDTLGHSVGDALLREVGERTQRQLRDSDTVARLGGDEFAILLPPPGDVVSALTAARKIRLALEQPLLVNGAVARTSASLGIALFPQHAKTAEALLDRADAAMYAARRAGSAVAVYDSEHDMRSSSVLAQLDEIGKAIAGGEFDLNYQPTVRLSDRHPLRAEALVRWTHAVRGKLRPAEFLSLAERGGFGPALSAWVLRTALRRCREWRDAGIDAGLSVNVGLRDLLDAGLPERIQAALSAAGLEARALTLDVSEDALKNDAMRLKRPLLALANIGVRLALDDFGTGTASLRLLQRLPLSEVKLDRRFVSEVCTNIESWAFVRSGIDAAHDLGLEVTAEGVEDKATAYVLERLGCDVAQGTYFTRSPSGFEPGFLRAGELDTAPLN